MLLYEANILFAEGIILKREIAKRDITGSFCISKSKFIKNIIGTIMLKTTISSK